MYQLQQDMISRVRALNPYDPYLSVDHHRGVAMIYTTRSQAPDVEFPLMPCDFVGEALPPTGYYYISTGGQMRLIKSVVAPGKMHRGMFRLAHMGMEILADVAAKVRQSMKSKGNVVQVGDKELVNANRNGYRFPRPKTSKRGR